MADHIGCGEGITGKVEIGQLGHVAEHQGRSRQHDDAVNVGQQGRQRQRVQASGRDRRDRAVACVPRDLVEIEAVVGAVEQPEVQRTARPRDQRLHQHVERL